MDNFGVQPHTRPPLVNIDLSYGNPNRVSTGVTGSNPSFMLPASDSCLPFIHMHTSAVIEGAFCGALFPLGFDSLPRTKHKSIMQQPMRIDPAMLTHQAFSLTDSLTNRTFLLVLAGARFRIIAPHELSFLSSCL